MYVTGVLFMSLRYTEIGLQVAAQETQIQHYSRHCISYQTGDLSLTRLNANHCTIEPYKLREGYKGEDMNNFSKFFPRKSAP